jgi:uncharacterized surface protein with fasciclin (FAS1) repeats
MTTLKRFVMVLALLTLALVPFAAAQAAGHEEPTILEIALAVNAETGEFSTLIAAVLYGQLDDVLASAGPYTVFAPTDAAFAKLGLNADNITTVPKKDLRRILRYHISNGKRLSGDVLAVRHIRSLTGNFVRVTANEDGAFINQSKLIALDIEASNGVIHIIDTVLIPRPRQ